MIDSGVINSGVETPLCSLEGNIPNRFFSTALYLAKSFGQPVDVTEVVQNPEIVEASPNRPRGLSRARRTTNYLKSGREYSSTSEAYFNHGINLAKLGS